MSFLKTLDKIGRVCCAPGMYAVSAADTVAHGGTFNSKTIRVSGSGFDAREVLRENGIDAYGVEWGNVADKVQVHKDDYKRAKKVLERNGYAVW